MAATSTDPAPPELPPDVPSEVPPVSPPPPAEPPTTDAGSESTAKPSEPGPVEPVSIAASILPQREEDAARHPAQEGHRALRAALGVLDNVVAAAEAATEHGQAARDGN